MFSHDQFSQVIIPLCDCSLNWTISLFTVNHPTFNSGCYIQPVIFLDRMPAFLKCLNNIMLLLLRKFQQRMRKPLMYCHLWVFWLHKVDSEHEKLLVAVVVLYESSLENIQFSMGALLITDGSCSLCQSGKHKMNVYRPDGGVTWRPWKKPLGFLWISSSRKDVAIVSQSLLWIGPWSQIISNHRLSLGVFLLLFVSHYRLQNIKLGKISMYSIEKNCCWHWLSYKMHLTVLIINDTSYLFG